MLKSHEMGVTTYQGEVHITTIMIDDLWFVVLYKDYHEPRTTYHDPIMYMTSDLDDLD